QLLIRCHARYRRFHQPLVGEVCCFWEDPGKAPAAASVSRRRPLGAHLGAQSPARRSLSQLHRQNRTRRGSMGALFRAGSHTRCYSRSPASPDTRCLPHGPVMPVFAHVMPRWSYSCCPLVCLGLACQLLQRALLARRWLRYLVVCLLPGLSCAILCRFARNGRTHPV